MAQRNIFDKNQNVAEKARCPLTATLANHILAAACVRELFKPAKDS